MQRKLMITTVLVVMLVAACGSPSAENQEPTADVAAIRTSAASTVVSQFTLTAAAFTPTTAPALPTDTPAPETTTAASTTTTATTAPLAQVTNALGTTVALCDDLKFVADVNIPDDTQMAPGQDFTKTWRVKNTGSCPWGAGYKLVYAGYTDKMSGQPQALTQVVQPGQEIEVSVQFTAPDTADQYLSAWQMSNPKGVTFGDAIFVRIIVQ